MIVLTATSGCDLDFGSQAVAIRLGSDQLKDDPVVSSGRVIHKKLWRTVQHGHHNINLAVVIKIAKCRSSMCSRNCEICSNFCTHVFKYESALVAKQAVC